MPFVKTASTLLLSLIPGVLAAQAPPTMPLSEIEAGMKGYGRTVFKGAKIERFDFEVLGIQRNAYPGRSRILVRCSGGPLAEAGIIAGMSGSPCYIEGRLVGALSAGFLAEKEPIGAITPIGEMLEQLQGIPEPPGKGTPLILPKVEPPKVLKAALNGQMIPLSQLMDAPAEGALPLPIAVSGLGEEAKSLWQGLPVSFLAAPASAGRGEASPLEPGGMVAINLVQGDLDMSASGTITYVSGKKLLLFGHPLFNLGAVDLPMWSASVAEVVPSYSSSFKLAGPVAPIGALRMDRSSGVEGVVGAEARMVPLRIGLNLGGGRRTLNFRYEIMDHPMLTPLLAATVLSQTLESEVRGIGVQSLSLQGNIKLAGQPPIEVENVIADLNGSRLSQFVGAMLQAVCLNPYEKPAIEGISLTVKAEERLDLTGIAGVRILAGRAKRGGTLPVLVTLQNIQGVRETATLNIPIPNSARPGKATLLVGDGLSLMATDPDQRAIDTSSLADVVRMLNGALRNNHAYALLVQQEPGVGLRGGRIEDIPPTVASLVAADGGAGDNKLQRRIVGKAVLPLEREVRGLASQDIEIE